MSQSLTRILAIIGILLGPMVLGLSFSLINSNLNSIGKELGASLTELQWIINIYGIFDAAFLVTMGRLGDIFGRKKIYLLGFCSYVIAMLGSGLATQPWILLSFQFFYGLSAAIILPISQAMLFLLFPEHKKSLGIALWGTSMAIASSLGFALGGLFLHHLSWRVIFLFNIPLALLGLILVYVYAHESKNNKEKKEIDWLGTLFLVLCVGSFILALVKGRLWNPVLVLGIYIFSTLCFALIFVVEKRTGAPVIKRSLFKNRRFFLAALSNFCLISFYWVGVFLIPLYLQREMHLSPLNAGLMMLCFSLPIVFISPLSGFLYNKIEGKKLILTGFICLLCSAIIQFFYLDSRSLLFIASGILFLGLGISLVQSPIITTGLETISKDYLGVAAGSFNTLQEMGGNIGLALTLSFVYKEPLFADGFQSGMLVMLAASILGLIFVTLIPKSKAN